MNETTVVAVVMFALGACAVLGVLDLLVRFAQRVTRGDERD